MLADLERLIALQQLDSDADDARRRLAEEPERLRQYDERLDDAKRRVDAAKVRLSTNQRTRRELEKEVAVHQGRLSKFRDQLMSVKTNVEYQAMQKEIEFAQSGVKALEDRELESMLEADELSAEVKRAEAALAAEQKAVEADRQAFTQELERLRAALERFARERNALLKTLDPQLVTTFELVASRRNGVAVAEARDGVCTICHVRLRPQIFNTVRRNAELIQCESCQRFLYFKPVRPASADAASLPAS